MANPALPPENPEDLDREICICFHVSRRKIENFIRLSNPQRPGQISECFGAGTGCGWCRPWLEMLWQVRQSAGGESVDIPSVAAYQEMRALWRENARKKGETG
jgi:bacterioferritin-associated ferredoxin